MKKLLCLGAAAILAAANPAAAQRAVVEVVPVAPVAPGVVGAAAVGTMLPIAPAIGGPTLGLAPAALTPAAPAPMAAIPSLPQAAATPVAAKTAAAPARAGALASAAAAAPVAGAKSEAATGVESRQKVIAAALPRGNAADLSAGSAHASGVAVEEAVTGARSTRVAADEAPVRGFWRSLIPSGLGRALRSGAAGVAVSEGDAGGRPAAVSAELQKQIEAGAALVNKVRAEVGKVIVGQQEMIDSLLISMISGEHVLLEGVPGVAKTATVKAFSDATKADFQRIQGTPDKLPSDILGAEILQEDPKTGIKVLRIEQGPVVTNILLVDEINRMMPKTQAALLEAMQERRITIGRTTIELPYPFIVLATQNPIEQEGTYRLPEAQQDRFMLKVIVNRPTRKELLEIMNRFASRENSPKASKITTLEEFSAAGKVAEQVYVSPEIQEWITHIVEATNNPEAYGLDLKKAIENGASPRAAIFLLKAARAHAFLNGRSWVDRSDIFAMAPQILRHRLILSYESVAAKITNDQVISAILKSQSVWNGGAPQAPKPAPTERRGGTKN